MFSVGRTGFAYMCFVRESCVNRKIHKAFLNALSNILSGIFLLAIYDERNDEGEKRGREIKKNKTKNNQELKEDKKVKKIQEEEKEEETEERQEKIK